MWEIDTKNTFRLYYYYYPHHSFPLFFSISLLLLFLLLAIETLNKSSINYVYYQNDKKINIVIIDRI